MIKLNENHHGKQGDQLGKPAVQAEDMDRLDQGSEFADGDRRMGSGSVLKV